MYGREIAEEIEREKAYLAWLIESGEIWAEDCGIRHKGYTGAGRERLLSDQHV